MNQSVRPPRILFVRPKSAGAVRSLSQMSSSFAPAPRPNGTQSSTLSAAPIILTGAAPPQPVRPQNTQGRRPSNAVGSRRCFTAASASALPVGKDGDKPCLLEQDPETWAEVDTENIYRIVIARKDAEEAAQQLARRIAHFRTQEERALRDMQGLRNCLEKNLVKTQTSTDSTASDIRQGNETSNSIPVASRSLNLHGRSTMTPYRNATPNNIKQTKAPSSERRRRLRVPRSREQLEFLAVSTSMLSLIAMLPRGGSNVKW